jgi:hypothetical protein
MNLKRFFGQGVVDRIEPPAMDDDNEPLYSDTVEMFYYHLDSANKDETPFIYVLDSMDSLSSEQEAAKFEEAKKAHYKGKEVAGSYGTEKASVNAAYLRRMLKPLRKSGSILLVIGQTHDNIGNVFSPKSRAGGHALSYYTPIEIWTGKAGQIKKTVRNKPRVIGNLIRIKVKKNRQTGHEPKIIIPHYVSYGFDDITSMIMYLVSEGHWKKAKKGGKIKAKDLDVKLTQNRLAKYIQEERLESDVQKITQEVWRDIEDACALDRKPRYE